MELQCRFHWHNLLVCKISFQNWQVKPVIVMHRRISTCKSCTVGEINSPNQSGRYIKTSRGRSSDVWTSHAFTPRPDLGRSRMAAYLWKSPWWGFLKVTNHVIFFDWKIVILNFNFQIQNCHSKTLQNRFQVLGFRWSEGWILWLAWLAQHLHYGCCGWLGWLRGFNLPYFNLIGDSCCPLRIQDHIST